MAAIDLIIENKKRLQELRETREYLGKELQDATVKRIVGLNKNNLKYKIELLDEEIFREKSKLYSEDGSNKEI